MTLVSKYPQLRTTGIIAEEIDEPLPRVLYVLRTRNHIQPTALAGRLRLYDRQAVAMVRHEINAIDARKGGTMSESSPRSPDLTTGSAYDSGTTPTTSGPAGVASDGEVQPRLLTKREAFWELSIAPTNLRENRIRKERRIDELGDGR